MSIEIGSKWVKDGDVVEVKDIFSVSSYGKNHIFYCFDMIVLNDSFITKSDFLKQYKPYETVYEFQFLWKVKDGDCWDSVTAYHKDIQECINSECEEERGRYEYQRLNFTKRERKQ